MYRRSSCRMPAHCRSSLRLGLLLLFLLSYLVIGAIVFALIEKPLEDDLRSDLRNERRRFLAQHTCLTDDELENFIVEIISANNRGVSAVGNVSGEPNWSFGQSVFFATTILTTIGYGQVTPLSEEGKVFCIFYALFGIPATLILFSAAVERLMLITRSLLEFLSSRLGHLFKFFYIRMLHLSIVGVVIVALIFFLPAAIFSYVEADWNYLDALYYCFISMTTIGLGDYIPGEKPNQAHRTTYKLLTTCYLFAGLTLMMLVLANIYDVPELNIGYHFYLKSDDENATERTPIKPAGSAGLKYTQQRDETDSIKDTNKTDTLSTTADE